MKVVHITTTEARGGAAIAVGRIHAALLSAGVDSRIFVLSRTSTDPRVSAFDYRLPLLPRLARAVRARLYRQDYRSYDLPELGERYELFTSDRCHLGAAVARQLPECDCVHLHWTSGFLDYRVLPRDLLAHRPAVWTLHDMNPFTGGCHYTQECTRFRQGCGRCPLLGARREEDASRQIFERKRAVIADIASGRLTVIGPSQWIADQARSSSILVGREVRVIPHPINTSFFAPAPVNAPDLIEIAAHGKRIVLFIAHSAGLPRKGYRYLVQALESAHLGEACALLTVGGSRPQSPAGIEHLHLSHVEDPVLLNQVYNLADVCIVPSIQEAFGMTAQEALAAGTPVIGFDTGGCADLIQSGENGLLVEAGDAAGLARALHTLFMDKASRLAMGRCARERICSQTDESVVAAAYLQVYQTLLAQA